MKWLLPVAIASLVAAVTSWRLRQSTSEALNLDLLKAIQDCRPDRVSALTSQGADPNARFVIPGGVAFKPKPAVVLGPYFGTPIERLRNLLTGRTPANSAGEPCIFLVWGGTHPAARFPGPHVIDPQTGYPAIVRLLLDHGADANARNTLGQTALQYAVWADRPEPARLLLEHGADPNVRAFSGTTPLMFAARTGNEEMVRQLLRFHADPNALSRDHKTVLSYAGSNNAIVRILKQAGARR